MEIKSKADQMSSTNYYLMLALVTALVILAAGYFGQALVKTSIHNSKVLSAVNKANSQLDKNLDAATSLVASYASISSSQELITNALPATGDYPGLISLLENAANSVGVALKSVSPETLGVGLSTPSATSGQKPFNFSTQVTGSYAQIMSFVTALQLSARPLEITSVQLSGTGSVMTTQISGIAYYQGDAALPFTTETIK